MKKIKLLLVCVLSFVLHISAAQAFFFDSEKWITIPVGDRGLPIKFTPSTNEGKSPTIFLVHGTNGPDARTEHWSKFFNQRGYNALIVDFKTGRYTGPEDRKNLVAWPLIDRAYTWLLNQPSVDPENIVWMGMSLGAGLGLVQEQKPWSAFIILYPVCWIYTKTLDPKPPVYYAYHVERPRTKPTLIAYGKKDEYEEAKYCPEMIKLMSGTFEVFALDNAYHGFDGNISISSFRDGASPSGFSSLRPNREARTLMENKIIEFLKFPR
jgi:dienelactone hydrolase